MRTLAFKCSTPIFRNPRLLFTLLVSQNESKTMYKVIHYILRGMCRFAFHFNGNLESNQFKKRNSLWYGAIVSRFHFFLTLLNSANARLMTVPIPQWDDPPVCIPAADLSPFPNFPHVHQSLALAVMSGVFFLSYLPFMFNFVFTEPINHYAFVLLTSHPVDVPKHWLLQILPIFPSILVILWDGFVSHVRLNSKHSSLWPLTRLLP